MQLQLASYYVVMHFLVDPFSCASFCEHLDSIDSRFLLFQRWFTHVHTHVRVPRKRSVLSSPIRLRPGPSGLAPSLAPRHRCLGKVYSKSSPVRARMGACRGSCGRYVGETPTIRRSCASGESDGPTEWEAVRGSVPPLTDKRPSESVKHEPWWLSCHSIVAFSMIYTVCLFFIPGNCTNPKPSMRLAYLPTSGWLKWGQCKHMPGSWDALH